MADNENSGHGSEQPIIIKKIKKGGHGHHGGAWKVAYADFVTAMMAFFIVMWILAQSEEVKQAVGAYFEDPSAFDIFTGKPKSSPVEFDHPMKGTGKGDGKNKGEFSWSFTEKGGEILVDSVAMKAAISKALEDSVTASKVIEKTSDDIKQVLNDLSGKSNEMEELLTSISVEITSEGLKIELLETHDNNFFEIGSAKLKPAAIDILKQLALRIGKLPNYVEIEGHTDSRKYSSNTIYSNWELSADRANAARKVLDASGLWNGQVVSVSGFADRKLRKPDNPFDVTNRRVSIVIKQLTTREFMDGSADKEKQISQ